MATRRRPRWPHKRNGQRLAISRVSNAWTMPIKARIDMLATGIRTPIGIKVIGSDLTVMDNVARQIERVLKAVPGTSSAYAERVYGRLLPRNPA